MIDELKEKAESKIEVVKAEVEEKVEKFEEKVEKFEDAVEKAKSRIPWKGMLIFVGLATLAALAFKGLILG